MDILTLEGIVTFEDDRVCIDSDFPCGSAGAVRALEADVYEVGYQPETIPAWFQKLLDDLFGGAGVPKEYMAFVRVHNKGPARRVTLRFLLSPKGASYMYPPWWVRRADEDWAWVMPDDTAFVERQYVDVAVDLEAGERVFVASAPYESPDVINEKTRRLAQAGSVWTCRTFGTSAQGRPLLVLESPPRDLKILVDATMQSCEPVSWGILHLAHWLTIPTNRVRRLLERVQFCLMPLSNPDGLYAGRSVTNSLGEVPKFGINRLVEGQEAPKETEALWQYLLAQKPDVSVEVHAHFTRAGFTRSIGMHDKASMPEALQDKAGRIEAALFDNYHADGLDNRKVLIDPRKTEHNVYGDKYVCEMAGTIRTFLQAVPDTIESHNADVREMVETVADALIGWQKSR